MEHKEIGLVSPLTDSQLYYNIFKKNRAGVDLMYLQNYVCHSTNRLKTGELIVHSNTFRLLI